jgi:predicted O-linked N-acetylglucosamine transferase (SPINDLY family)
VAKLVRFGMNDAFAEALMLHRAGRLAEAEARYRVVLDRDGGHVEALHHLGLIALERGDAGRALDLIGRAVRARPGDAILNNNLANARRRLGHRQAARTSYRRALATEPGLPDGWANLGALLGELGEAAASVVAHIRALALDAEIPELHFALSLALGAKPGPLRRTLALDPGFAQAWVVAGRFARGLALRPDLPEALVASGVAALAAGRPREALASLDRAPGHSAAAFHRGNALFQLGRLDEAAQAFTAIANRIPEARLNLASVLRDQGRTEEARSLYDRMVAEGAGDSARVKRALMLPIIPASLNAIEAERKRLAAEIAAVDGCRLGDPVAEIGHGNFYLAYHGRDDRALQEAIGRFYRSACPDLSEDLARPPIRPDGRIAIGFVSTLLRTHTIGRLNRGLIETLDRRRFHVTLIAPDHGEDPLAAALARSADRVLRLPARLAEARRAIADLRLDLLYFPDIGMEPMTYFLAYARLASVQVMSWGHPDTTGLGTVDWMLSADCMEPVGGEAHYVERLARLPGPTIRMARPKVPARPKTRAELGLPEGTLYVCPQSLFKLHPEGDAVFARILAEDRRGHLVLIHGRHPNWARQLIDRLSAAGADPARIVVLPHLGGQDYLSLLSVADVVLDPIHYSGGHSSLEALAMGAPIVTWPGRFMRARHTAGFYRLMQVEALVARDFDHYVDLALGLANDRDRRARHAAAIADASARLFDSASSVTAIEDFLESAVANA